MSTATANLENDHIHILRLIDVMDCISHESEANVEHLEAIVNIIRNFADGLHHAKEENLLFPKMVEKGFSFEQGPIAVMMHDHVLGRNFVKGMSDNIALYKAGNKASLTEVFRNFNGYGELLKAHIAKENNVLFRMADKVLSGDEQQVLLNQFHEEEKKPACAENNCIIQIDNLVKLYNL
ncbi:MAG: hemerythrin domain-containing protein [Bacteroidota bacterium]|nr:hemerythrin domain-containing protein [Bacteroidota bacterium]